MNINIPREYAQIFSSFFLIVGMMSAISHPDYSAFGVAMMVISCWLMLMSESILLAKVQTEMSSSLEQLRKKQEIDIQDLLGFLREARIGASPFSTVDGARKLAETLNYPAMIVSNNHQIIMANKLMHTLLGWDPDTEELNGNPVYLINHPNVMSKLGGLAATPEVQEMDSMITQYVYIHKSGKRIFGQLDAHKIGKQGFFAVFHPAAECLLSVEDIISLTS